MLTNSGSKTNIAYFVKFFKSNKKRFIFQIVY